MCLGPFSIHIRQGCDWLGYIPSMLESIAFAWFTVILTVAFADLPVEPFFFFFNDTATTEIYTLSLHDALPIFGHGRLDGVLGDPVDARDDLVDVALTGADRDIVLVVPAEHLDRDQLHARRDAEAGTRSEEHTSELQSHHDLVCRLLLEKKKKQQ